MSVIANPKVSVLGQEPDLESLALVDPAVSVAFASPQKLGVEEVVPEHVQARVQAPPMGPTTDASADAAIGMRQKRKAHSPTPGSRPRSRRRRDISRDSDSEL